MIEILKNLLNAIKYDVDLFKNCSIIIFLDASAIYGKRVKLVRRSFGNINFGKQYSKRNHIVDSW